VGCMLFSPIHMRGVTVPNRAVLAPMDQFSAENGSADEWHLMHYGKFAAAGLGMMITEVTGVSPEARITPGDLGLYSDENERALARVRSFCRRHGKAVFGVQLGHAGQKASTGTPWEGRGPVLADAGGWRPVAPSAVTVADGWPEPEVLDGNGLRKIKDDFARAARRADRIGFDFIEIHGAHGYLLHQFMSPVTNRRSDDYGGALENRIRFPLEVFAAVRAAWPADKPIGIRVSATDWIENGWDVADTVVFAKAVEDLGCDYIHVSSGGISREQKIVAGLGYQVGFAAAIKAAVKMAVIAVGQIHHAYQAESILRSGQADMVALGRALLYDPHWVWHAATDLGEEATYPPQYERGHPSKWGLDGLAVAGKSPLAER